MHVSPTHSLSLCHLQPRANAVQEAFIRMFDQGIIYRANRLVNWCCALRTAISDIEVDYLDIEPKTKRKFPGHDKAADFGCLTSFAYKVEGTGLLHSVSPFLWHFFIIIILI